MHIVNKLQNVNNIKNELKTQLNKTGQDTNVKFREFTRLIENIPEINIMSQEDIDTCVNKIIEINGENA